MYQRNKSVRSWLSDSHLAIEAHFDDPVHSILLTLQISREDKTVTDIQAQFIRCPFPDMCPKSIEATSKAVIGLGIGPGFNKALRERLPATSGCVHISALLREAADAVVQTEFYQAYLAPKNKGAGSEQGSQTPPDLKSSAERRAYYREKGLRNICIAYSDEHN